MESKQQRSISLQAAQQLEAAVQLLSAYEDVTGRGLPDTPLLHFIKLYLEVGLLSQEAPTRFPAHGSCTGSGQDSVRVASVRSMVQLGC